jgi:hypothetical protein
MAPRLPVSLVLQVKVNRMVTEGGQVTDTIKEMRISVHGSRGVTFGSSAVESDPAAAMNVNYAVLEA